MDHYNTFAVEYMQTFAETWVAAGTAVARAPINKRIHDALWANTERFGEHSLESINTKMTNDAKRARRDAKAKQPVD